LPQSIPREGLVLLVLPVGLHVHAVIGFGREALAAPATRSAGPRRGGPQVLRLATAPDADLMPLVVDEGSHDPLMGERRAAIGPGLLGGGARGGGFVPGLRALARPFLLHASARDLGVLGTFGADV